MATFLIEERAMDFSNLVEEIITKIGCWRQKIQLLKIFVMERWRQI